MGGAIVRGLASGTKVAAENIWVSNPSQPKLDALKACCPALSVTTDNRQAAEAADYIVLAVKPWLVGEVLGGLSLRKEQVLLSPNTPERNGRSSASFRTPPFPSGQA